VNQVPHTFTKLAEEAGHKWISYNFLEYFTYLPAPQFKYFKNWVDASLQFDLAIITSDLVLTGQSKLSPPRIENELIPFLNNSLTRFGAYAILMDVWVPNLDDDSVLINQAKILAATVRLDEDRGTSMSLESFQKMVQGQG
ncbi:MAG: hypothetical protein AAGI38_21800, partial [Bacteroidota bacterium]